MQDYTTTLSADDFAFLNALFPGDMLHSAEDLLVYRSDASLLSGTPLACVRPSRREQVQELMHWANAIRLPLYVRGRGTNLVGDCVPVRPGLVISTLKMNHILDISATDFVAEVEPGVNTAQFQAACEAHGLFYPPDPATVKASTLGGNVVTGAGGMRALKYGVTRDFVLGAEVVLPGGEVATFGGRTHKNVVGLDLARIMVGSEGTLGFISKLWLKLLPKPETSASLLLGYASCEAALNAVGDIFAAGLVPSALEYMGEAIMDVMARDGTVPWPASVRAALLLRLDGSHDTLPLDLARVLRAVPTAIWHRQGLGAEQEALWEIRRRINPLTFTLGPDKINDDVTVPRGSLVTALKAIEAIAARHAVTLVHYGHVGDGNIHVNLMYDAADPALVQRVNAAVADINRAVLDLGGTLSGEHGCGICKDFALQLGPLERKLMHGVREVFDPKGIMNPGKGY